MSLISSFFFQVAMSVLDALLSRQTQLTQQRSGPSPSSEPDIVSSAIVYQWIDLYALKLRDQRGLATLLGKLQKAGVELGTFLQTYYILLTYSVLILFVQSCCVALRHARISLVVAGNVALGRVESSFGVVECVGAAFDEARSTVVRGRHQHTG
jgi:hypothetical protein